MLRLALDQSIRTTGYAIYEDGKLVQKGHWTIPSSLTLGKRLHMVVDKLNKLHQQFHFDEIDFEDIQLQQGNVETYKKLAYVQAMIVFFCEKYNIPYKILSPSHWRSILKKNYKIIFGRKRQEQKKAAREFVIEYFNFSDEEVTEDECDAICLGLAAQEENKLPKGAF